MNKKDWTLLAIASAHGEPVDPLQLQKSLFLLGEMLKRQVGTFYHFKPYHYGPFDAQVYRDAEELENQGLVTVSRGGSVRRYQVTPQGLEAALRLRQEAPARAVKYLEEVVQWARSLSFQDLVRAIYTRFPEYRTNSVFVGQALS